jgi:hypothetical protein
MSTLFMDIRQSQTGNTFLMTDRKAQYPRKVPPVFSPGGASYKYHFVKKSYHSEEQGDEGSPS